MRTLRFATLQFTVLVSLACAAQAQDYPSKPVRLVTQEAGGGNDNVARLLAMGMAQGLGQQLIVDNRAGSGGVAATESVAKAAPDGHTLLSLGSTVWILPLLQNVPYEVLRDLAPISLTGSTPAVLVVHPEVPARNVREFIAYAKSRPGQLNYGSGSSGSSGHLSAELFKSMAGVDIQRVAYKGGASLMADVVSGRVQLSFAAASTVIPHVKAGKLRALGVTTLKPSELMPGVPPMATEGLPGYEVASTFGLFAPARTPAPIIGRLNQEAVRALRSEGMKDRFLKVGVEIVGSSPQELAAFIKAEQTRLGKVIRDANITLE